MDNRRLAVAELQPEANTAAARRTGAGHRAERVAAEDIERQAAGYTAEMQTAAVHTAVQHRAAAMFAVLPWWICLGILAEEPGYTE